ncbi:MAG TPA: winged helix-turn-helix domain-containing protein [Burkholderiaceae bacterium]|nr:winged helix-turn-helix domain-containing protein [Burkholderiaceae bacterium]
MARELRIGGKHSALGPRGVGLLTVLVENRHRAIPKHELLDTVWRGVIVEENNLQVQVSTLRRLLGPQAIATVPGRGYRFMLPVAGDAEPARDAPLALRHIPPPAVEGNLPEYLPELYGRELDRAAVQALVEDHALVTIAGPAGIGKTRLALEVARTLPHTGADGVWMVELSPLNDATLVPQTIAQALRLTLPGLREPAEELAGALRGRAMLLVLDNCEHLTDFVGPLVDRLLRNDGRLRILATSQEPLRVNGEHLYRLAPLSVPAADARITDPGAYGAVRLFVERVRALAPQFGADPAHMAQIIDICRRLDGIPLAIELAAARVPVLGVAGVRERLGERFRILSGGSRVAPKRHQTLRAAMDWSHTLLEAPERAVYRRLGVFVGSFSLEAAQELAASPDIDAWAALEHLSSLVEKSLVIAEGEPRPRYRMLESTREHALEQLAAAHETDAWLRRHALATWHALEQAIKERRTDLVLAEMGNVRCAYEHARGRLGDAAAAVALATLPSMVLAVEGAVQEARQRLLDVEPLVDATLPLALAAQYWQWYGRIGLGGRLPPSRCIEAFQRAERIFVELRNPRHVHACRRHAAEAMLDAGDLEGAAAALARARAMEGDAWPLADRMRRLRVEGLCFGKAGRIDEALQTTSQALDMAQAGTIDRYELVLLDDIARMYLEAGHAHDAAERYRTLAARARRAPNAGLTLSNALAGLIAALTADDELEAAETLAREALPALTRSGILVARADILAWLMARLSRHQLAARLLGASEHFRSACETVRDVIEQRCREQAFALLRAAVPEERLAAWQALGAEQSEDELASALSMREPAA